MRVDGDYLEILFHPQTHRVVNFKRKWRELNLLPQDEFMTEEEAISLVNSQRENLRIPTDIQVSHAEKAIIEYKRNPERAGKAKDLYAWIVHFYNEWGDGEAHVDAINREVVNVIPSG